MSQGHAKSRLERTVRAAMMALAALIGTIMATAAPAQKQPQRIVAVGDLHGDYQAWQAIALNAGIINAKGHWAGGKTILVQMGDVTDRWADSLKIIRNLQLLQAEAPRAGGRVVVVLGNHEAMNLLGDFRYTTPGEYAAFVDQRSPARREQLYMRLRKQLEAAAQTANPSILPSQVRDQWLALYATFTPTQKAVVRDAIKARVARMEAFREKMQERFQSRGQGNNS